MALSYTLIKAWVDRSSTDKINLRLLIDYNGKEVAQDVQITGTNKTKLQVKNEIDALVLGMASNFKDSHDLVTDIKDFCGQSFEIIP